MAMKQVVSGRTQCKVIAKAQVPSTRSSVKPAPKWKEAGLLGVASTFAAASPALAEDAVDSTIESVIGAVKSTGELIKSGITTVDSGVKIIKQGYDVAAPVIDQGIKVISPYAEKAAKVTLEAASPAIQAALPAFKDAEKAIGDSLNNSTVDAVVDTTSKAVTVVTPVATSVVDTLLKSDAVTLGEYALGALALVYLGPPLLGVVAGSFRGYAGTITAAQVLDALSEGSAVLIDIRSEKEKESSGIPDVPSSISGKVIEVEFAVTEDKKLRGSLRDPNSIEAAVTSLQIASLKRVNKGTKIILLDRYGSSAVAVAKELGSKGFGKVFVVQGGFDGRGGWVQSKLQIKPAATILSAPAPSTSRSGTSFGIGTRKALPSPKA